jgi:3-hydroxyacyl-CoA dehydrogenase / enoyl-CoA hydratase / 3-hydroxybutyryl-CoA epimerase
MTYQHLRIDGAEASTFITVWIDVKDRSVNVLCSALFNEVDQLLDQLEASDDVRPVVFRSGKPKGFVVGADLNELATITTRDGSDTFVRTGLHVFQKLQDLSRTTIAVIQGPCLGGGLEWALACSHRICIDTPATQLGFPEVKLCLIPGWGGTFRLPKLVGISVARDMMLSGNSVSAEEADRTGLAHRVSDAAGVEDAIEQILQTTHLTVNQDDASNSDAVAAISRLVNATARRHTQEDEIQIAPTFAELLLSKQCQAALQKFFDTRSPTEGET